MKRIISIIMILVMSISLAACGEKESEAPETEGAAGLFDDIAGVYDELFPIMLDEAYDQVWEDACKEYAGEQYYQMALEFLRTAYAGDVYGEEAIALYKQDPQQAKYDTHFIEGVRQITFRGNTISAVDANGKSVFKREYRSAGEASIYEVPLSIYVTDDEDAGTFKYFCVFNEAVMLPVDAGTTDDGQWQCHVEFRHAASEEELLDPETGEHAYWIASGVLVDTGRDRAAVEELIRDYCWFNLTPQE